MYDYIFRYLCDVLKKGRVLLYGKVMPSELAMLLKQGLDITLVDEDVEHLVALKKDYSKVDYNQSLYFVKETFDYVVQLSSNPIMQRDYLDELGLFIQVEFIATKEDYHRLLLEKKQLGFHFLKQVHLYKRETVIALDSSKDAQLNTQELLTKTPNALVLIYSDFEYVVENSVALLEPIESK